MNLTQRLKRWANEELNPKEKFREFKKIGRKHGPGFLAYAIGVEAFEDVILPGICIAIGHWELAPAFCGCSQRRLLCLKSFT